MIESLAKTYLSEIENSAVDFAKNIDTSKPLDFSSKNIDVATGKSDINKSEINQKESFSKQNSADTSNLLDFSKKRNIENRELTPLSEKDKSRLKSETGWSDEIVDAIGSKEETEIYKNAGLVESEINDRSCLINPDINMLQKDDYDRTNKERMEQGLAPLDSQGRPIELHHIGQKMDSPLAELTQEQHRGKVSDSVLHDKTRESEIDRKTFSSERENHWKTRIQGV